ncbi:MAG TPA: alkaline phosphatase family protein [Beijerinckiaceae bacterium]|jgi:predicted AlkP superfamily phosphohydrolase/phosphomutase
MSRSPVLLVGLDACDPAIAQALAEQGQLPALGRLFGHAARCRVRNPFGLFVGALWMTFATGLRPDRHFFHSWDEIDVETYRRRMVGPPVVEHPPFWQALSDAGRRVAVIDVPHAEARAPVNGINVVEWGCHDRHFGFHTWPPKAAAGIEAAFGLHPVFGVDAYAKREFAPDDYIFREGQRRTPEEEHALAQGLLQGLGRKGRLSSTLLAEGGWDLFLTVFGESHAVGHQQWHLHDPAHPRFDAATTAMLGGDPVVAAYRALDASLGDLLDKAGDDATVLVLLSHGMGPHNDGTHLLEEILRRLDLFDEETPLDTSPRALAKRAARTLPAALQRRVTAFAVPAIRRRIAGAEFPPFPEFAEPEERARRRFFLEPNNYVFGGVRLNLAGREPSGCVRPDEVDAVCRRLTKDLLALVNVDTGGPVIRAVERSDRRYSRSKGDRMPDLFIDWERSAPIETVWSPKVGLVHAPYTHWRSGDHRPDGLLLAAGPGLPSRTTLPTLDLEDLAPSIAARLGVTLADCDGRAAPWLAG